jgi:hypothetical protein
LQAFDDRRVWFGSKWDSRGQAQVNHPILGRLPVAVLDEQDKLIDLVIAQWATVFLAPGGHGSAVKAAGDRLEQGLGVAGAQVRVVQRRVGANACAVQPMAHRAIFSVQGHGAF